MRFSDTYSNYYNVFYWRFWRDSRLIFIGFFTNIFNHHRRIYDICRIKAPFKNNTERRTVLFYTGIAALPEAADWKSNCTFCSGQNAVCPWQSSGCRSAAGLIIWIMANVTVNDMSILNHCADFLDPFAKLLGLDGVILIAFILGMPANEIVFPIIIMAYLAQGSILELGNLSELRTLLITNGWNWITAGSMMLFSLMHWPCSTTLITIKKETGSMKWTVLSFLIPTLIGTVICFLFSNIARLFV